MFIFKMSLSCLDLQEEPIDKKSTIDHNPTERICEIALEIIETLSGLKTPVKCQIGFHTGSVVSGLVGSRLQFCLFGEAVNIAGLMCSKCEVLFV